MRGGPTQGKGRRKRSGEGAMGEEWRRELRREEL